MKRSSFSETANSFARLSKRKAQLLVERGAKVVGHVAMFPDGRRVTADQGVVVYHEHQIIGPAEVAADAPDGPPGQGSGQPPAMLSEGPPEGSPACCAGDHLPSHTTGDTQAGSAVPARVREERTLPAAASLVGIILKTKDGERCVIDSGLVSWHRAPITHALTTRADQP